MKVSLHIAKCPWCNRTIHYFRLFSRLNHATYYHGFMTENGEKGCGRIYHCVSLKLPFAPRIYITWRKRYDPATEEMYAN